MWVGKENDPKRGSDLLAILLTSIKAGTRTPLIINTRAGDVIASLTDELKEKEDSGFVNSTNSGLLRTVVGRLRMHAAPVSFMDLDGSQVSVLERKAASLAKGAIRNERPMVLPPIPTELHLTGVKLSKITQSIAYRNIIKLRCVHDRPRTEKVMEKIIRRVKEANSRSPSRKQVWSSLRSKDFSKPLRIFLWKCAHDAYKVGMYWDKQSMDPILRERSRCKHDGEINSMEHILTKCECVGQELVWESIRNMWKNRTNVMFPEQCMGSILGSPISVIKDEDGRPSQGLTRLYRLVVTEAASFVWAIRCERVIRNGDEPHCRVEVANRWTAALGRRAELDFKLMNRKLGKKSIPISQVLDTWIGTCVINTSKWQGSQMVTSCGVLVGSSQDSRAGIG
ncbi:hypothetical protein J132_08353 [Termitomyces sp. J132]|nr:hypothetical protein J132_08353 [Termitomyces sp. J132]